MLYKKTIINRFCPSSFQDEFKDGAIIKTVKFQNTFLDNIFTADGITTENTEYDVQISITPKGNNVPINSISSLNRLINALSFKRRTTTNLLSSFNSRKMILRSPISNSEKVFEMDDEMTDFVPVVFLDGRINDYNDDETPNFNSLDLLCKNYLRDEVLQEIRLDLSI